MRIHSNCFSVGLALAALLLLSNGCAWCPCTQNALTRASGKVDSKKSLREALLFVASFDHGLNADYARGDATLYSAPSSRERDQARPGLPENGQAVIAGHEGRFGDALRITKKMKEVIFFKAGPNVAYNPENWSGSVSLWLKLNPQKDLEPGYCDPLQLVGQNWTNGVMFVEFSKDEQPRHFRYGIQALPVLWNPKGLKWDEIPEIDRPLAASHNPPFGSDHWVHVVFTFNNINTGLKDGTGRLYLNGQLQGVFSGFNNLFEWDASKSAITLGASYVGLIDDLSVYNRALTPDEVTRLYTLPGGATDLLNKPYNCWPVPYRVD